MKDEDERMEEERKEGGGRREEPTACGAQELRSSTEKAPHWLSDPQQGNTESDLRKRELSLPPAPIVTVTAVKQSQSLINHAQMHF